MRAWVCLLVLAACRDAPAPHPTATTATTATATPATTAPAPRASDGGCLYPCGPAPKTICCSADDKCCAEGVAAAFYCYSGPGDCPMRP